MLFQFQLLFLLSSSYTSYLPTGSVLPVNQVLPVQQGLPDDQVVLVPSDPLVYDSYDYPTYLLPREDSYTGIDSYGVPVADPITAPSYSYNTPAGTGYGAPIAPVISTSTETPQVTTEPPANRVPLLFLFLLWLVFLWPVTVFVEGSNVITTTPGAPSRRKEEEDDKRTELIIHRLAEETTMMEESTTIETTTNIYRYR